MLGSTISGSLGSSSMTCQSLRPCPARPSLARILFFSGAQDTVTVLCIVSSSQQSRQRYHDTTIPRYHRSHISSHLAHEIAHLGIPPFAAVPLWQTIRDLRSIGLLLPDLQFPPRENSVWPFREAHDATAASHEGSLASLPGLQMWICLSRPH